MHLLDTANRSLVGGTLGSEDGTIQGALDCGILGVGVSANDGNCISIR